MKFKFKYVSMLVAAAMIAGFTSCSNSEEVVGGSDDLTQPREDDLTIQIEVPEAKDSRGESTTNVGIAPHTFDMTLIFVGKESATTPQKVLKVIDGNVSQLTSAAGQKFKSMPLGVEGLYVIGNTDVAKYPATPTTPANFGQLAFNNDATKTTLKSYEGEAVSQFMKNVMIKLDNYSITDAKAVNISGYAPITTTQGTTPVRVLVTPAISRYEIRQIKEKNNKTFTLNGIYISNTMRQISIDGQEYPNDPAQLINYGWNSPNWNATLKGWDYNSHPAADKDASNPNTTADYAFVQVADYGYNTATLKKWYEYNLGTKTGASSYEPSAADKYWSFYIASARKQDQPNAAITNPYLDEGNYNRVGLECGTWPYGIPNPGNNPIDELKYVNEGASLVASGRAETPYSIKMEVPTWAATGLGIQYGTFPAINIEVTLSTKNSKGLKRGWLTVTKFLDADNNNAPLQYPKPGTVYVIKSIIFDQEENLKPDPMFPEEDTDISVQVIVQGWVGQNTNIEF